MQNCGVIILAAGASSRLGEPKQLLVFRGETLLARMVRIALGSKANPVVVVTGAHAEECASAIMGQPVRLIYNPAWQEGIASSIRAGVASLSEEVGGLVILLCDQPAVSASLIDALITSKKDIAACGYGETKGPPVYFKKMFFNELLSLQGDKGAKVILENHGGDVEIIPFPEGEWDVDFPDDRNRLQ